MNFPHFIGFQILERSKYHMYSLIYEKIYPKLQIYRPTIIYSDTDSIIMYISVCIKHICNNIEQTSFNEFLKVIEKLSEILDTSNMHTQHPCYSNVKRNICGIFKNEFPLHYIESFVGLSPKTYSIKISDYQVRKLLQLLKEHFYSIYESNIINVVINDIECTIIYVDKENLNKDQFLTHFQNIKFNLEPYYSSKIFDMSNSNEIPLGKKYFDNKIYQNICERDNLNTFYFYIELSKNFDIYIYDYDVTIESRPLQNFDITKLSQFELLNMKSKCAKGVPEYLKHDMSHNQYYETLVLNNQNENKIKFDIIRNDRGVTKTMTVDKQSLRVRDVKKKMGK